MPFEEAMFKMRQVDKKGQSPDFVPPHIDEEFAKLIEEAKPAGNYFQQSLGDKLLYIKRIDKLKYDVVEQE